MGARTQEQARPAPPTRARVGYLGPAGTFSEEALLASAEAGAVEPVPLPAIYDAVMALRRGELEWAIAPIENSLEGSISVTLDLLADQDSGLQIVGEACLRVSHSLIAHEAIELADIDTVFTHPQVPGQCARFLRGELARARVVSVGSTAEAVRTVTRERVAGRAALGTTLAAKIYGGTVIRERVEDRSDNETRFVWLAREEQDREPPLRRDGAGTRKTSLVFWGAGAERPGWLVRCLEEFARRDINLTKIESRPRRERLGSYMFFADLAGGVEDAPLRDALAGVRSLCELRVLGSYPAAVTSPLVADARPGA
jgi:prephenate dehydratase